MMVVVAAAVTMMMTAKCTEELLRTILYVN